MHCNYSQEKKILKSPIRKHFFNLSQSNAKCLLRSYRKIKDREEISVNLLCLFYFTLNYEKIGSACYVDVDTRFTEQQTSQRIFFRCLKKIFIFNVLFILIFFPFHSLFSLIPFISQLNAAHQKTLSDVDPLTQIPVSLKI